MIASNYAGVAFRLQLAPGAKMYCVDIEVARSGALGRPHLVYDDMPMRSAPVTGLGRRLGAKSYLRTA